jgi:photosystem II stability/assembly factor-like uncharacterized protein
MRHPRSARARYLAPLAAVALISLVTLLSSASAGVNTPYSGWYSGNPLLGPNRLADLACAGETCYASGDRGVVLKSTNGGVTWAGIVTGLTVNVPRIKLISGDANRLVIGGGCAVRRSDDGGETFSRLPFAPSDTSCPFSVAALSFPSSNVGYLVLGDGNVVSTADLGRTFSRKTAIPGGATGAAPPDLLCTTETTCFAATSAGTIQRTTDGGGSWTQVGAVANLSLRGLEAVGSTLYAVGNGLAVLKSTDGGATWVRKLVAGTPPGNMTSIRCANASTCLIATEAGNQVIRTDDGGDTFTSIAPSTDPIHAVEFASATRALAVGSSGSAAVSDDAGKNWRAVGSRIAGVLSVLHAGSGTVAYAGGVNGVLAQTTDAGQTWSNVSTPTTVPIRGIAAPTAERVFVLATDGTVQRSDNGGRSYKLLSTGTTASPLGIVAVDANVVLLAGPIGVRRSTDGGETFHASTARAVRQAGLGAFDRAGAALVVYGGKAIGVSTDGGASWRAIKGPKKQAIREVDFVSPQTGFLLDLRGRLWKTTNAGRKWGLLNTAGTTGYLIDFTDAANGYMAATARSYIQGGPGADSNVLRTSDGGLSWRPQLVSLDELRAIESAGGTDYALVGESALFATTTGGSVGAPQALSIRTKTRVLKKAGRISVSGKLTPTDGGETAVVSRYVRGQWLSQSVPVAANGSFATRWDVRGTSVFVAQVLGDADHAGAGTKPLTVKVLPPKKKKSKRS